MARPKPTPEEQLLKLIEKGSAIGEARFRHKEKLLLPFSDFKKTWFMLEKKIAQLLTNFKTGLKEPNLKILNKIFLFFCVIMFFYSVMDFVINRPNIDGIYKRQQMGLNRISAEAAPTDVRPFLHYLEMVRRRNVFSPITLSESEEQVIGEKQLQEMAKDLSLVGISLDNQEPLVMIEDKAAQKTYFLRKGDEINQFKIKQILKNRVILSFEDQTIDLM